MVHVISTRSRGQRGKRGDTGRIKGRVDNGSSLIHLEKQSQMHVVYIYVVFAYKIFKIKIKINNNMHNPYPQGTRASEGRVSDTGPGLATSTCHLNNTNITK